MRRFLLCGGLDGKEEALDRLVQWIEQRNPEAVLLAGGLACRHPMPRNPKEVTQREHENIRFWERCFETLGKTGVFTALVPGVQDVPERVFLRAAMDCEIDHPNLHVVHHVPVAQRDVVIQGAGGHLTDHEDTPTPQLRVSRTTLEYFLRQLARAEQPQKVLLVAEPPTGKLGGEGGNPLVGELIDSYHPRLCVALGETAHRGWERVAHTTVVNPGRLSEGSAAWLDWSRPVNEQVELLGEVTAGV